MFRGIAALNIDTKGRLAVPRRYRDPLGGEKGQLIITIDPDETCLLLYPLTVWEIIEQKLEALPSLDKRSRRLQRLLIGHATDGELDAQGRVLVPGLLRQYASLEKEVVLIGQGKKFELWDAKQWQACYEVLINTPTTAEDNDESSLSSLLQQLSL